MQKSLLNKAKLIPVSKEHCLSVSKLFILVVGHTLFITQRCPTLGPCVTSSLVKGFAQDCAVRVNGFAGFRKGRRKSELFFNLAYSESLYKTVGVGVESQSDFFWRSCITLNWVIMMRSRSPRRRIFKESESGIKFFF